MEHALAEQLAAAFGGFDSPGRDLSASQDHESHVTRVLESLLPDLDAWAVVDLRDVPGEDSGPMMLATKGAVLWTATLSERAGDPRVMARPYEPADWRLVKVVATLERGRGEEEVGRDWHISLEGDRFAFTTEEIVRPQPSPTQDELLGRALATCKGWEIRDLSPGTHAG
jgi:hypothetical protein